jgi:hypothetical protein
VWEQDGTEVKNESRRRRGLLSFRQPKPTLSAYLGREQFGAFRFDRQPSYCRSDLPINSAAFVLDRRSGRTFEKPLSKGREKVVDVAAWFLG